MKHTKGPWYFSEETGRVYFKMRVAGEEPPICDMNVDDIMAIQDFDEVEANGRLISAAPEMLEVLEILCANDRLMNSLGINQATAIMHVIKKARGEK